MSNLAKQIIRQQWRKRHNANPDIRRQASSLILAHVLLLRQWRRA